MSAVLPRFVPLILLLSSCAVAPFAAAAAIGIWVYDENNDYAGQIVISHSPEAVYAMCETVARARGTEVVTVPGSMRVECEVDNADVVMQTFIVPGEENVAELKVRAISTLEGRAELARDLALDVQNRLDEQSGY